jgi:hypothetical protein
MYSKISLKDCVQERLDDYLYNLNYTNLSYCKYVRLGCKGLFWTNNLAYLVCSLFPIVDKTILENINYFLCKLDPFCNS